MGESMPAFYHRDDDTYNASVNTRGPWDEGAQHGGPPSALLLHTMQEEVAHQVDGDFAVARLTTEFLRPVPIAPLTVRTQVERAGRTAIRMAATLLTDREVMTASAIFLRLDPAVAPPSVRPPDYTDAPWPDPKPLEPFEFPFFTTDEGYHRAIEVRLVDLPWGATPIRVWARPKIPLVDGEHTSPEANVVILADAESGMGPPVDPFTHTYANPDLTVYFARRPKIGFVGLDIRSSVGDAGVGLSEASLRDAHGIFGRSAQSLVVRPR